MIEPIIAALGLGAIVGIVLSRKVPRFIIKEVIKEPFNLPNISVKKNGDKTSDVIVKRKNREPQKITI